MAYIFCCVYSLSTMVSLPACTIRAILLSRTWDRWAPTASSQAAASGRQRTRCSAEASVGVSESAGSTVDAQPLFEELAEASEEVNRAPLSLVSGSPLTCPHVARHGVTTGALTSCSCAR